MFLSFLISPQLDRSPMSAIIMPMDENIRKFCIASMAFIMVVGSIPPSHKESAGPERDRIVARGTHDHTHNEPYEYEHIPGP